MLDISMPLRSMPEKSRELESNPNAFDNASSSTLNIELISKSDA